jgi:cob(I)alamin adenosyltransferase
VREEDVAWLEEQAKGFEDRGVRFQGWARPGAEHSVARAGLDLARSVARRAERRVWELHEAEGPLPEPVRLYFNRLSDLLWILARVNSEKLKS